MSITSICCIVQFLCVCVCFYCNYRQHNIIKELTEEAKRRKLIHDVTMQESQKQKDYIGKLEDEISYLNTTFNVLERHGFKCFTLDGDDDSTSISVYGCSDTLHRRRLLIKTFSSEDSEYNYNCARELLDYLEKEN